MLHRSLLVAALVLVGCNDGSSPPDDLDPTDCPEWFPDADGDGFGEAGASPVVACEAPEGHVDNADDCDDTRAGVHPGAVEVCDEANLDEDCNGLANDDDPDATGKVEAWPDLDGDGYGDSLVEPITWCDVPDGWSTTAGDCDDDDPLVNPDAQEVCDEAGIDEDCNGLADDDDPDALGKLEAWPDLDADGFGDGDAASDFYCIVPAGWSTDPTDCDDDDPLVHPHAVEICDDADVDEDCNGLADDDDPNATGKVDTWLDTDGDGYGDDSIAAVPFCDVPAGRSTVPGDCDDDDPNVNPGAQEVCDDFGVDEDCNGLANDDDPNVTGTVDAWPDLDGDGYGNDALPAVALCDLPAGWSTVPGDCDDNLASAHPGAAFLEDPNACMVDTDEDGWGDPQPPGNATPGTDCDPLDPNVNPGMPDPVDGVDQDCDGFDGTPIEDDFELGTYDPAVWSSNSGNVGITTTWVGEGSTGVDFWGTGGTLETVPFDVSGCSVVGWHYLGMQGGAGSAEEHDYLTVEYFDGTEWRSGDAWEGGLNDGIWYQRWGSIPWQAAFHANFKLRIRGNADLSNDHFYFDDFKAGCLPDSDGDGTPDVLDCAPDDPVHWSDCGVCIDQDEDGWGAGCDLGGDCHDNDDSIHPTAPDVDADLLDTDCSGVDGLGFFDDFESGDLEEWRWAHVNDRAWVDPSQAASGSRSMHIELGGEAVTAEHDLGSCAGFSWSFQGKRGPPRPDAQDVLRFEVLTDSGWRVLDEWFGGATDPSFAERNGHYAAGDVDTSRIRFRFQARGKVDRSYSIRDPGGDSWFVDDLLVECDTP